MSQQSNERGREALSHATVALGTVYAGVLLEGAPPRLPELAVAVAAASVVLATDAREAYGAWRRGRPTTRSTPELNGPTPDHGQGPSSPPRGDEDGIPGDGNP